MGKLSLLVIFVLSTALAFVALNDAQHAIEMHLTADGFRTLCIFGYVFAGMSGLSGVCLALGVRS